jgi:hypothetical protein
MSQIETTPMNNSTVLRVYSEKDEIDNQPEYQRNGDIWNLEKRQLLIDSILNDYDIPKIYFHALSESKVLADGRKVNFSIIDGRQRIESVWQFIDGKIPLSDDFVYLRDPNLKLARLTYNDIAQKYPKIKVRFDGFVLPIVLVKTDDIDLIEDMFSRLNEAMPLNAAEKRNAFGGPMPKNIKDLSAHQFFVNKVKFRNNRYQFNEVATRLLFLEDSITRQNKIFDTKKTYLDAFVKSYKTDATLDPNKIVNDVRSVLNTMITYYIDQDPLISTQASVPIYYLLFRTAIKQGRLDAISHEKLIDFRDKVNQNRKIAEEDITKADYDLLEFNRLSIQGTNDASSIRDRLRIICNFFNLIYPELK